MFMVLVKPRSTQRSEVEMTPEQCKMTRAGLGLGVRELADLAQVSTNTSTRLERGESLYPRTIEALRAALEAAGIELIAEDGGGPGVRMKKRTDHASSQQNNSPLHASSAQPVGSTSSSTEDLDE